MSPDFQLHRKAFFASLMSSALLVTACGGGGAEVSDTDSTLNSQAPQKTPADQETSSHALAVETAGASGWVLLSKEFLSFNVGDSQTVRFGSGTQWVQKTVSGTGQCTNEFFGSDPAIGVLKECDVLTGGAAVPAAAVKESLFTTQTPAVTNNTDGVGANYELGMRFTSTVAGQVTGVRFYKSANETGTHTGKIWSSAGTLLGSVVFSSETASGWQTATFATPIQIAAGTPYTVTTNTGATYYSATVNGFASQIINGSLSTIAGTSGVFGPVDTYPTQSWQASNYFRDVVFTAAAPTPATAPTPVPEPAPVSGTAPATAPGTAPAGSAALTWTAPTTGTVTGYRVYYGTASRSYNQAFGTGTYMTTTSFALSGLPSGQIYYFTVTAIDSAGQESAYSDEESKQIL